MMKRHEGWALLFAIAAGVVFATLADGQGVDVPAVPETVKVATQEDHEALAAEVAELTERVEALEEGGTEPPIDPPPIDPPPIDPPPIDPPPIDPPPIDPPPQDPRRIEPGEDGTHYGEAVKDPHCVLALTYNDPAFYHLCNEKLEREKFTRWFSTAADPERPFPWITHDVGQKSIRYNFLAERLNAITGELDTFTGSNFPPNTPKLDRSIPVSAQARLRFNGWLNDDGERVAYGNNQKYSFQVEFCAAREALWPGKTWQIATSAPDKGSGLHLEPQTDLRSADWSGYATGTYVNNWRGLLAARYYTPLNDPQYHRPFDDVNWQPSERPPVPYDVIGRPARGDTNMESNKGRLGWGFRNQANIQNPSSKLFARVRQMNIDTPTHINEFDPANDDAYTGSPEISRIPEGYKAYAYWIRPEMWVRVTFTYDWSVTPATYTVWVSDEVTEPVCLFGPFVCEPLARASQEPTCFWCPELNNSSFLTLTSTFFWVRNTIIYVGDDVPLGGKVTQTYAMGEPASDVNEMRADIKAMEDRIDELYPPTNGTRAYTDGKTIRRVTPELIRDLLTP